MALHVVSLPHTDITRDWDFCAYTAKVRRFAKMMAGEGQRVYVYGSWNSELPPEAKLVTVLSPLDRERWFGTREWPKDKVFDCWDPAHPCWQEMNARAIEEIQARIQPQDKVCLIAGGCQRWIAETFRRDYQILEWGIGYSGVIPYTFKCFESYAWRHHVAGLSHMDDLSWYDTVIPNSFDPEDYLVSAQPGDYLLYLARPTPRKGQDVLRAISQRTDLSIITAGQGGPWLEGAEHVGVVLGQEKAKLLAGARALVSPTVYLEPFGGVVVEAMMSGTPVLTTDWGAFTETVRQGIDGYRCATLGDFMESIEKLTDLDRMEIAGNSRQRYSTNEAKRQYLDWLYRLDTLYGAGWYS